MGLTRPDPIFKVPHYNQPDLTSTPDRPSRPEYAMAHPLFGPEIRQLQQEIDVGGMKVFCETLHPATVSEALTGELDVEGVWRFLKHSDIRTQAAIFEYFP